MRTLTVLVVTTLTAALASPTAAARVELRGIELRAGPAIAGEGFAFAEEPRRDRLAVRLVGPDGAVRALPQFDPLLRQGRADERYVALEASASRIAVGFTLQGFVDTPAGFDRAVNRLGEIQAAAPDGPTGRLVRCRDEARLAGSLAVDGNAVAYDNPECVSCRVGIRE